MDYPTFLKKAFVVLLVVLLAIYIRGWTAVRYDKHDALIGNKITFSVPMVRLTNLPDNYANKVILNKYGSVLTNKRRALENAAWFPTINLEDITCDEVFIVEDVIYEFPRGVVESIFSPGKIKYYVISSQKYEDVIIRETVYASYSKNASVIAGDRECAATVE